MPRVDVNRMSFYYEEDDFTDPWREEETVFIQHGFGRSSRFFYHWVPALARDYKVIRRDMRGHGLSDDPPPGKWTIDQLVDDIVGFFDALKLDKVHYVGESAGGVMGVALAARYPDRLKSLTLMSTPITDPTRGSGKMDFSNLADTISSMTIEDFTDVILKGRAIVAVSEGHERWMRAEWAKNRTESLTGMARLFPEVDLAPVFPTLRVPVLLLSPANSHTTTLDDQKTIHSLTPGSRMEIIDGKGHEIYFEKADECLAAFTQFLASMKKDARLDVSADVTP
ncbi:alpha/beta fold hydrolase [Rhizorhabdus argentea]|uniref:alpha/beta fold hydrolase n=1 Tax=Rhizorhabdus argentea TaxID=1387174 RepID=UPI0030EEBD7A